MFCGVRLAYLENACLVTQVDGIVVTQAEGCKGEGVYIYNGGTLIMTEGEISNNKLGGVHNQGHFIIYGGKISNNRNTYTHITSVTFIGGYGGGVYNNKGNFEMFGGEISGNTADMAGCGVYNRGGNFTMHNGKISNNKHTYTNNDATTWSGDGYGGGVANSGTFEMFGGEITGNTANKDGGGVSNHSSNFTMYDGIIVGNTAEIGGGVACIRGSFTMYGGTISGNKANQTGGGVHIEYGTFNRVGGTISGNTALEGDNIYLPESPESNSWPSMVSICVSIVFVGGIVGGFYFYESKKRKNHKG